MQIRKQRQLKQYKIAKIKLGGGTNSTANQPVADAAVSSQATSESAVKSTTAVSATPTESNEGASSANQPAQVAAPQDTTGAYLNGQHNATQTPAYEGNYGKIAGTYSVEGKTEDVTQDLIKQNDPNLQKASAVYRVVERFPDYYNGEGVLTAQQYADAIGDSANADKYKGYVYKIKLSQPITAYRAATKNLLTGDINYDGPYSLGNSDLSGSVGFSTDDKTCVANTALDYPENYDISSSSYSSPELDSNQRHVLNYTFNAPTATVGPSFNYDLINGYQFPDENEITFNELPASQTFYIDYTAQTQDVTQQMIDDKSYPADHMKQATYQVVEKFPASYKGEGTLTAEEYAKEIGDSDISKYEGYVYKIIANQTVTAYQTATKNLATGEVTYTGPYNAKYLTYETTTPDVWDHQYSPEDKTYIGAGAVDQPAGYTISADPAWTTPEKDANGQPMVNIYYISSKHAFYYDFMIGTNDFVAKNEVKFDSLPDSHNFYINYIADKQTVTINYIDTEDNNKVVSSTTLTGTTAGEVDVPQSLPADLQGKYELDGTIPATYTFTADSDQTITVKLTHATVIVQPDDPKTPSDKLPDNPNKNYPSGVSKEDLNKTITRTVKITNPDGSVVDKSESLSFERTATVDEVTGEVTYGNWTPVKGRSDSFGEVDVPQVPGYTASQSTVPAQSLTNDKITNWQDTPVNITYTADPQSTKIIYQTADGKQVGTTTLNGVTDQTIDVSLQAPAGYWIDKDKSDDQKFPATYTFKASDNQPITVIVVKKEDGNLPPTTDDKDVALIIQYQDKDGKVVGTQIVTGKVGANEQIKLDIPDGYYSSQSKLDHTFKDNDSVEIISVTKKEEHTGTPTTDDKKMAVIVEFKDQDGKVVGTQVIEGDEGTTDTFDLNIPDGYYSSSDQLTHTFKQGDSTVTVDVTKKEEHTGTPTIDDKDVAVLVEYTDPSGKVIKTDIISGKSGSTIQVPNDLPAGYQTTGDVPTTYTIGKGDHQVVVINVTPINADSGSTQPDQPNSGSDTPSSSANPGSDTPAQSGASDSGSAQPDQPSSGSEMPSSSADSAANSNSAAVTPSEPTSSATASAVIASDAPATSASAVITGQAVVTSATPVTATPAQSQATQGSLPQTGNDSRKATSIVGLALASLAGILGFGAKRKKEN